MTLYATDMEILSCRTRTVFNLSLNLQHKKTGGKILSLRFSRRFLFPKNYLPDLHHLNL